MFSHLNNIHTVQTEIIGTQQTRKTFSQDYNQTSHTLHVARKYFFGDFLSADFWQKL